MLWPQLILIDGEGRADARRRAAVLLHVLLEQSQDVVRFARRDVRLADALFTPPQNLAQHVDALGALRVGERRRLRRARPLLSTAARHLYQMSTTLSYIASAFSTWFIEKKTLASWKSPPLVSMCSGPTISEL